MVCGVEVGVGLALGFEYVVGLEFMGVQAEEEVEPWLENWPEGHAVQDVAPDSE